MVSIDDFKQICLIREVEEHLTMAFDQGKVPGLLHPCFGGEALAVGVASSLTRGKDMIFSSHRCHGHAIAGGIDVPTMIDEILGLPTGINGGHAGTQHLNDPNAPQNGGLFMSGNGIVGAQVPLALGAALTARNKNTGGVAVVFFGDGAMNQGGVMESFNLAVVQKLPVIFICENNGMAQSSSAENTSAASFTGRAEAFGLKAVSVDGRNVGDVKNIMAENLEAVRGGQPLFIEASIDRLSGHYHGDDQDYLTDSKKLISADDPLVKAATLFEDADKIHAEIKHIVQKLFADKGITV